MIKKKKSSVLQLTPIIIFLLKLFCEKQNNNHRGIEEFKGVIFLLQELNCSFVSVQYLSLPFYLASGFFGFQLLYIFFNLRG